MAISLPSNTPAAPHHFAPPPPPTGDGQNGATTTHTRKAPGGVHRILVVDDSNTERTHLSMILDTAGYQVRTAESGAAALSTARDDPPDLILLDIVMADMDGFRACRELKRDPATQHIPVVMVSSKNNKADHIWAREQGAEGYIAKPFTDAQVLDEVRRF